MKWWTLIFLILFSSCTTLDKDHVKWSKWDKACGAYYLGGHGFDMVSTEEMLDRGHRELNPILGEHPSDTEVAVYGVATTLLVLVIADQAGKIEKGGKWLRKAILLIGGSLGIYFGVHNTNLD